MDVLLSNTYTKVTYDPPHTILHQIENLLSCQVVKSMIKNFRRPKHYDVKEKLDRLSVALGT